MLMLGAIYRNSGGSPAPWWNDDEASRATTPFWKGIAILNKALPADVRAPSVNGLAEHMHRNKVLSEMLDHALAEAERRSRVPLRTIIVPRGEKHAKQPAKKRTCAPSL
jgi:hypothetical protein